MTTLSLLSVLPEQHDEGHTQLQLHIDTLVTQIQHPQPQVTPRRPQRGTTWQVGADGHLRMKWRLS